MVFSIHHTTCNYHQGKLTWILRGERSVRQSGCSRAQGRHVATRVEAIYFKLHWHVRCNSKRRQCSVGVTHRIMLKSQPKQPDQNVPYRINPKTFQHNHLPMYLLLKVFLKN